jgi:DNA-binding protein HU-beta
MNKSELIKAVSKKTGMNKKATRSTVNAFIESVKEALKKGDKVALIGFGSWATRERAKRNGVNPRTGKKINIPAKTVPYFKAGKELKDAVK